MSTNKITNALQNLFTKSRSSTNKDKKLKTDAAPITTTTATPNNLNVNIENTNRSSASITPINSLINEPIHDPLNRQLSNSSSTTNNNNQINQAYSVYQISNVNGLHIGSVFNVNNTINTATAAVPSIDRRPAKDVPIRKTKSIDAMMKCTNPLNHRTMDIISTELGVGWRDVIRHLGFSDGRIEQMHEENHIKGIKEVIYQFLLEFHRNDDNANLGYLTTLLWKCEQKETVYILKEYWKNGELQSTSSM